MKTAQDYSQWRFIANNTPPEEEGRYWVLDRYGSKECCLYGNSGAPNENTYFFDGENVKAKDIIAWIPKEEYPLLSSGGEEWKEELQKAYEEIWKTQIYPFSTKGKPKADDILKKYFPFLIPERIYPHHLTRQKNDWQKD